MFTYKGINYKGVNFDARTIKEGELFVPLIGERDGHDFIEQARQNGATGSLCSKNDLEALEGFQLHPVKDTLEEFQNIAREHRKVFKGKVIAITGSNGKTTVKEMIDSILSLKLTVTKSEGNFNNHLGVPFTILNASLEDDIWIIEAGTNHPGEIGLLQEIIQPNYVVITNVGDAHIGNFGSRENIGLEKYALANGIPAERLFVTKDNSFAWSPPSKRMSKYVIKSQESSMTRFTYKGEEYSIPVFGSYNVENALLAIELSETLNIDRGEIQKGLASFHSLQYRQKWINEGNLHICLDCYNASPTSLKMSAKEFGKNIEGKKLYIFGDLFELGKDEEKIHRGIGKEFAEETVWYLGKLMKNAYESSSSPSSRYFSTIEEVRTEIEKMKSESIKILVKGSRGMGLERIFSK